MAVGDRARADVLHERRLRGCGAADRERHDAAAVEEQQPADRPAEQQLALAVVEHRVPVHLLRERQAAQHAASARRAARRPRPCRAGACGTRGSRPSASRSRSSAATSTPCFVAKPAAAGVGVPSGLNAADTGGPVTSSSRSVCRSATRATRTVSRRGVLKVSTGAVGRRAARPSAAPSTHVAELRRQRRQPAGGHLFARRSRAAVRDPSARARTLARRFDRCRRLHALDVRLGDRRRPAAGRAGCRPCARSRRCCRSSRGC